MSQGQAVIALTCACHWPWNAFTRSYNTGLSYIYITVLWDWLTSRCVSIEIASLLNANGHLKPHGANVSPDGGAWVSYDGAGH